MELITGGYNYWTQSQYPPTGGTILQMSLPITNNIVLYRLTNNGSCGSQAIDFLFWAKEAPYGSSYRLSPNPATDAIKVETLSGTPETRNNKSLQSEKASISKLDNASITNTSTIKAIEIVDMTGIIRYRKNCSNLKWQHFSNSC